jgi:hypothetical protein
MDLPSAIATDAAMTRQNFAFSAIKQNADQAELFAKTIDQTARSAPVSETRGSNVDLFA